MEVTKSKKWYFYDNGIRNALISNFKPLSLRNDIGQLWEQFVLSERINPKNSPQNDKIIGILIGCQHFRRINEEKCHSSNLGYEKFVLLGLNFPG